MKKITPVNVGVVASLLFLSTSVLAMPTVSGNTLTWPADQWYQVQSADTFVTVCEGNISGQSSVTGGPCVVESGQYIVINHSTGERFENISTGETTDATNPDTANPIVTGNGVISWPDDGWYQVQNAESYATVCEGGVSCTVPPGNYIVINHSTGTRYDGISVDDGGNNPSDENDDTDSLPSTVVVQGNTILMPDDGWYQVQDATTFTTMCEGSLSCSLQAGQYNVINHTTSERWENIQVGSSDNNDNDPQQPTGGTQMAFLAPYGLSPYGNLPIVDYAPWLAPPNQTIPQGILPDDCMLDSIGLSYCYQSDTRLLSATLSSGDPLWSFTLPSDNRTNRIDGLRLVESDLLAIAATTTSAFGYPSHEISLFTSQGAFKQTIDLFQIDGITWPIVNLQGEPLIVDAVSNSSGSSKYDLRLIANMYELIPGGNRSVPDDWFQSGVIEARIDPSNGSYLDIEICRGATVISPSLGWSGVTDCANNAASLGDALYTLNETINTNTGSGYFNEFAHQIIDASNVSALLGISTDLPCLENLSNTACLTSQLPTVGSTIESSSSFVACSTDTWDSGYTGTPTAQLTQRLVRTSTTQAELYDEFSFAHRCAIPDSNGTVISAGNNLTGNATLVSTINLSSGEIISRETRFNDLTSVRGNSYLRFYDGTYFENSFNATSEAYQLSANHIEDGVIGCSRSCSPAAFKIGDYRDLSLSVETSVDNMNHHSMSYSYTNATSDETTRWTSEFQFLSTDNSITENDGFDGYAEFIATDGSLSRIENSLDADFPGMNAVKYSRTYADGSEEQLTLPIQALTQFSISVVYPQ